MPRSIRWLLCYRVSSYPVLVLLYYCNLEERRCEHGTWPEPGATRHDRSGRGTDRDHASCQLRGKRRAGPSRNGRFASEQFQLFLPLLFRHRVAGSETPGVESLSGKTHICTGGSGDCAAIEYFPHPISVIAVDSIHKKGEMIMEHNLKSVVLDVTDLEEELIEITPVANYEESDAQDLPETGASHANNFSCSSLCCSVIV